MAAMIGTTQPRWHRATAEVNVTPFVDVMLVLLIVFMVAAPLATVAVPINLSMPEGPAVSLEPVFVSLQDDGTIFVGTKSSGETRVNWATLGAALHQKSEGDPARQLLTVLFESVLSDYPGDRK